MISIFGEWRSTQGFIRKTADAGAYISKKNFRMIHNLTGTAEINILTQRIIKQLKIYSTLFFD